MRRVVTGDGTVRWFDSRDRLHSYWGPAVEYNNGDREWWTDGVLKKSESPKQPKKGNDND